MRWPLIRIPARSEKEAPVAAARVYMKIQFPRARGKGRDRVKGVVR